MNVEYINPFVRSTVNVFATMLDCKLSRGELRVHRDFNPKFDVTGIIGLTGIASGTVVVSLERNVALSITGTLLEQEKPNSIDSDVIDAVGELTNMIAGSAKADLEHLKMKIALPTVITGKNHVISFGSATQTISIPYTSEWGDLEVEVGLVDEPES